MLLPITSLILALLGTTAVEAKLSIPADCQQCRSGCEDNNKTCTIDILPELYRGWEEIRQQMAPENLSTTLANLRPQDQTECEVKFYLLCAEDGCNTPTEVRTAGELQSSCYDPAKPTRFLLHGWMQPPLDTCGFPFPFTTGKYYCTKATYNVILVDYTSCTPGFLTYFTFTCYGVVKVVRQLLDFIAAGSMVPSNISMEGFSLGCQVAAAVADAIYKDSGVKVFELIGLDCAGPAFDWPAPISPLCGAVVVNSTHAERVIIYGSNAYPGGFGMHLYDDNAMVIYVNGGQWQCWGGPFRQLPLSVMSHIYGSVTWTRLLQLSGGYMYRPASEVSPWSSDSCRHNSTTMIPVGEGAPFIKGKFYLPVDFEEFC